MPTVEEYHLSSGARKVAHNKKSLQLGYESDSEDNNYDSDEQDEDSELITKAQDDDEAKEDEDDDMFASQDEEDQSMLSNNKKQKGFDMDQFEREQGLGKYDTEQNSGFQDIPDASTTSNISIERLQKYDRNSESYNESQERLQDGNEIQLEAFDLREEAESGNFDKDMNYTKRENSDDENEEDSWLVGIKSAEIRKAREAQQKQDEKMDQLSQSLTATEELLGDLIKLLEPAETPMEALARLRPKKLKRNQKNDDDQERKKIVFSITDLCETLSNDKGIYKVYDMSREALMRSYYAETGKEYQTRGTKRGIEEIEDDGELSSNPKPTNVSQAEYDYGQKIWEYRWLDNKEEVLGMFSSYEMKYWKETYFDNAVEVRLSGEDEFRLISDVDFED